MRQMPDPICINGQVIDLPTVPSDEFDRLLKNAVGDMTEAEEEFVRNAVNRGWTLTTIIDAINERRMRGVIA